MKRKRKQYSGAFKARVGLEALMGIKTTAQIAREHQVHPLLVGQWKATLRERMHELFERGHPAPEDSEKVVAQLHQKIGQLTVDLDWLKKKSKQLGL
jgi:transposase-like protein